MAQPTHTGTPEHQHTLHTSHTHPTHTHTHCDCICQDLHSHLSNWGMEGLTSLAIGNCFHFGPFIRFTFEVTPHVPMSFGGEMFAEEACPDRYLL